jgi:hypothetical protein
MNYDSILLINFKAWMLPMKLKTLATLILLSPFYSQADMTCNAQGCTGVPYRVLAYPTGAVNIFPISSQAPIGGNEGPLQCIGVDNNRAIAIPDGPGKDRTYSMILASISTQKSIFIRTPDSTAPCNVGYVRYTSE